MYPLSDKEFKYISERLYRYAKINLTQKKRSLVVSRLSKRIKDLKLTGFSDYISYLENNDDSGSEFQNMVDALSTNYSLFFREPYHYDFLAENIISKTKTEALNIWSAASSTGQEIYSILISLLEYKRKNRQLLNYKLFASDISGKALTAAARGIYPAKDIEKIDNKILERYFLRGSGNMEEYVKVKRELINRIWFFKLNLTDPEYRLPLMDIIFLRNAIIYFDKETKISLINRLHYYIKPGGYLFLGHSESLSGISEKFYPVGKTVYKRIGE